MARGSERLPSGERNGRLTAETYRHSSSRQEEEPSAGTSLCTIDGLRPSIRYNAQRRSLTNVAVWVVEGAGASITHASGRRRQTRPETPMVACRVATGVPLPRCEDIQVVTPSHEPLAGRLEKDITFDPQAQIFRLSPEGTTTVCGRRSMETVFERPRKQVAMSEPPGNSDSSPRRTGPRGQYPGTSRCCR